MIFTLLAIWAIGCLLMVGPTAKMFEAWRTSAVTGHQASLIVRTHPVAPDSVMELGRCTSLPTEYEMEMAYTLALFPLLNLAFGAYWLVTAGLQFLSESRLREDTTNHARLSA